MWPSSVLLSESLRPPGVSRVRGVWTFVPKVDVVSSVVREERDVRDVDVEFVVAVRDVVAVEDVPVDDVLLVLLLPLLLDEDRPPPFFGFLTRGVFVVVVPVCVVVPVREVVWEEEDVPDERRVAFVLVPLLVVVAVAEVVELDCVVPLLVEP